MKDFEIIKKLSEADGIPGFEDEVRELIKSELIDYVDQISYDKLGSIIGLKKGEDNGLNIGIFAHMDEVGFIIKGIDSNGFLRVYPLGSWNPHMSLAMEVRVTNSDGKKFYGVMTTDKKTKDITIDDLYVELGFNSREEVLENGILEGDMVTPYTEVKKLVKDNVLGKALDDRLGIAVMIDAIKNTKSKNNIYGVGTVQEEAGTRGGKTSVTIAKPDLAIVVDIATSKDTPNNNGWGRKMGKGPALVFLNKMAITNKKLYKEVRNICEKNDIKYQFDILNGGTDSGPIHLFNGGVPTIELIIPIRNAHTNASIFNYYDYEETKRLVRTIIEEFDKERLNKLLEY